MFLLGHALNMAGSERELLSHPGEEWAPRVAKRLQTAKPENVRLLAGLCANVLDSFVPDSALLQTDFKIEELRTRWIALLAGPRLMEYQ